MSKKKKFRHGHFLGMDSIGVDQDDKPQAEQEAEEVAPAPEPEPSAQESAQSGTVVDMTPPQAAQAEAENEEPQSPADPLPAPAPAVAEPESSPAPEAPPSSKDANMQTQKVAIAPELDQKRTGGQEISLFADQRTGAASTSTRPAPGTRSTGTSSDDTLRLRREEIERARRARAAAAPPSPSRNWTGVGPARGQRGQRRVEELPRREYAARNRFGVFSFFFGFIGLIFKMVFVTVLVMALATWLGYEAVHWYVKTPQTDVPNLRGMRVEDAIKSSSGRKLGLLQERTEASGVAPGEIIDQKPLPGSKAKEGTLVRVTVSSGRAGYMVPDVVGETRENAINKIKGARLELGNVAFIDDPKLPKDSVISQDPVAGKGFDQPVKVGILVSSGPKGSALTMPELTGRTLGEAKTSLANLGVTDVEIDPPGAVKGRIVTQEPMVGKVILQSQHIVLKVKD